MPDVPADGSTRAIADLVRRIVHARRGLSRAEAVNWVLQFLDDVDRADATARVNGVIDLLCELQDIGHGTMRDERVLVSLPERRVALPDGMIVALGDHGISVGTGSEKLFPEVTGGTTESLVEVLASFDESESLIGHQAIEPFGRWTGDGKMPAPLRKALSLSGTFDPVEQKWSISEENTSFLNEWFGLAPLAFSDLDAVPDETQLRVAKSPAGLRMVVEAGPGSGKTHVACERVISLVEGEGLAASRILLLSFTRIAVAELRDRIGRRLGELPNAAALQVRTFDSFAARLLANAGLGFSGSHDASIRAATRLMRSDNPLVADALGQLEHVIIDEAQDLVGDRKEMCEALLALLHPTCGITVFGDFAQSIYGYQRRGSSGSTLLAEVAKSSDYACDQLGRDHRTRTEALKEMFSSVRETLRGDPVGSREGYFRVRDQIRSAAVENDIKSFTVHPSTTVGLILTRSRRGLFTAAEQMRAAGRHFRLRLPDRPIRIEPWIGALLGGLPPTTRMSQNDFRSLHEALSPAPWRNVEECWEILLDLDASGRDMISVANIAEGLEDPPLELISNHEGSSGPLLSTIHAIKGREAERVMLLLTRAPSGDRVDWAEEARILYVGATRASSELRTGWISPRKFYKIGDPERYWAAHPDHRMIEIGLEGDLVDWAEFVRSGHVVNEAEAISCIWRASIDEPIVAAYPDTDGRLVLRIGDQDGAAIGCLSHDFIDLVQALRKVDRDSALPEVVAGISVVGATTIVVPGRSGEAPRLALMPLLGGFGSIPR
ncbi:UvrD-helicase domain-containing protein [Mesobacterium sp. TK19101]|uniref:UvrD-helicase domain-containing protein n=1 Tax=Mesobacterium hydrothermale TaxID=3111907 RepID=A0ABU6HCE6_9RHOB|nr:UvrD-helicase domain-containing protein [Mesobacterium sp. TK19101]MEC3860147.1 UvrD-helicase domain-containing protein [Mesobacterium sp. TK19101]